MWPTAFFAICGLGRHPPNLLALARGNAHSAPQRTSQPSARPGPHRQCPGAKRSRQGAAQPRGLDGAEPRLALGPQQRHNPWPPSKECLGL